MPSAAKRPALNKRVKPTPAAWKSVLERADFKCEWTDAAERCDLADGDIDPVGGGTVRLTPDHRRPHSSADPVNPSDSADWQALCGRHQVMKKNFWDDSGGKLKLNAVAIVQAASVDDKRQVFLMLKEFFEGE